MLEQQSFVGTDVQFRVLTQQNKVNAPQFSLKLFIKHLFNWIIWKIGRFAGIFLRIVISFEKLLIAVRDDRLGAWYWGRSSSFKTFFQSIVVFFVFIMGFIFFVGRESGTTTQPQVYALDNSTEEEKRANTVSQDVIVESGSLETLIPKNRARIETEIYVVRPNDTIKTIGSEYGISVDTIKWANNIKSDSLRVGQKLKIPPGSGILHKVKKGDALADVARKYGASPETIAEINFLDKPYTLNEGTEIFIPDGKMPEDKPDTVLAAKRPDTVRKIRYERSAGTQNNYKNAGGGTRFLGWPVISNRGQISQCSSRWHTALDIYDGSYPPLVSSAAGKVIFAGRHNSGYALTVVIDHGNGYSTLYAHMNRVDVRKGQFVNKGQRIGVMGATGWATGVHVHFEIRKGKALVGQSVALNPSVFLQKHVCGY